MDEWGGAAGQMIASSMNHLFEMDAALFVWRCASPEHLRCDAAVSKEDFYAYSLFVGIPPDPSPPNVVLNLALAWRAALKKIPVTVLSETLERLDHLASTSEADDELIASLYALDGVISKANALQREIETRLSR